MVCEEAHLSCRLCPEMHGDLRQSEFHRYVGGDFGPRFIRESPNLVAFPALGEIVPGHVLVSTKSHYLSMGHLTIELYKELEDFLLQAEDAVSKAFNSPVVLFEHGAVSSSKRGGCCLDHAHIHLVPASVDIRARLRSLYQELRIKELVELQEFRKKGSSYLFFQGVTRERFAYDAAIVPSQMLRRLVCMELGVNERWDWMDNVEPSDVRRCMTALSQWSNTKGALTITEVT